LIKNIEKTIHKYDNFHEIYDKAYIGIPKGYGELKKPFIGFMDEFVRLYPPQPKAIVRFT